MYPTLLIFKISLQFFFSRKLFSCFIPIQISHNLCDILRITLISSKKLGVCYNMRLTVSTAKDSNYFLEVFCNNSLTSRRRVLYCWTSEQLSTLPDSVDSTDTRKKGHKKFQSIDLMVEQSTSLPPIL